MRDSEDLLSKVKKAIAATGYPLELEIAAKARRLGWIPFHSVSYEDPESGKLRELDLLVYKIVRARRIELRISCKSSLDKQFVFFTRPRGHLPGACDLKFTPVVDDHERRSQIRECLASMRFFSEAREAANYTVVSGKDSPREARALLRDALLSSITSIHDRILPRGLLFDPRGTLYFFLVVARARMFESWFEEETAGMETREIDYVQWSGKYDVPTSYYGLTIPDVHGNNVPFGDVMYWFSDWIRVEILRDSYFETYLRELESHFAMLDDDTLVLFGKPWSAENFPRLVKGPPGIGRRAIATKDDDGEM